MSFSRSFCCPDKRVAAVHLGGYGFPSSHSQFMGYFAAFMLLHLHFRHRFSSTSYPVMDLLWALAVRGAVVALALIVCYSRYDRASVLISFNLVSRFYLGYHTLHQVSWGFGIGIAVGSLYYVVTEYIPFFKPNSLPGKLRRWILKSSVFTWLRIKDGWAVWQDGGHEEEYKSWRKLWETKRLKLL
jgi:dolichyldiphosphatase